MFDVEMFFGRFHPVIVHLPLGFLILAVLFRLLDVRNASGVYHPAFKLTLQLSVVIAVITCITGLLLSWSGTYPEEELDRHLWSGVALAAVCLGWYLSEFHSKVRPIFRYLAMGMTVVLLLITGHRGGILTHGESYLWEGMPPSWQQFLGHDPYASNNVEFNITNIDSALVYEEIVVPILEARCYACHSDRKQKGELRLDSPDLIIKGGESGDPLIRKELENSKLYHVLTLAPDDDLHMPPKGKTQLTDYEIEVIGSWISEGGEIGKLVMQYQDQQPIRRWYDDQISDEKLFSNPLIPTEPVSPADEVVLDQLRDSGLLIQPVGANNNYLDVSFINVRQLTPALINDLIQFQDQIIWVDLSGHQLSTAHLDHLIKLGRITDLNLSRSTLPDGGLAGLSALQHIQILNLTGTKFGDATIDILGKWPELRKAYIYQSDFSKESIIDFIQSKPQIQIDTGGYQLPMVPRDTIIFKYQR